MGIHTRIVFLLIEIVFPDYPDKLYQQSIDEFNIHIETLTQGCIFSMKEISD